MQNFPSLLLIVAALASCASAPVSQTPLPVPEAKVSKAAQVVKAVLPVSVKSFKASGAPAGSVTTSYNPQGLVISQQVFNSSGTLVAVKYGGTAGEAWRVVESTPTGTVVSIEDRVMGPHGELLSVTLRNARELPLSVVEYEYDARGRAVAVLAKTGDGRLKSRTAYTYDSQGNNSKVEVFDGSGALNTVFERQFENGRLVVEKGYDASGNVVELTRTTWKDGRKLVQETVTPVSRVVEYSYDGSDAPVAVVKSVRGQVIERQTFEYQAATR